jgi:uridine kinase
VAEHELRPILDAVDRTRAQVNRPILIALDGRSGVGKSTLANTLVDLVDDGRLIVGDDFYAGGTDEEWAARTPSERRAHVIDWARLRNDALKPLLAGEKARWQAFDWETGRGLSEVGVV